MEFGFVFLLPIVNQIISVLLVIGYMKLISVKGITNSCVVKMSHTFLLNNTSLYRPYAVLHGTVEGILRRRLPSPVPSVCLFSLSADFSLASPGKPIFQIKAEVRNLSWFSLKALGPECQSNVSLWSYQ